MATMASIYKKAANIKNTSILNIGEKTVQKSFYGETRDVKVIDLDVRPYKNVQHLCPVCMKKRPVHDHKHKTSSTWRASDINGVQVYLHYRPARVKCPEHKVLTEYIPWADGTTRSTADFNNEVTFMALTCPKTVVAQFFDINWRTVGNCIAATHNRIEPDPKIRLKGLKRICVDETSYKKGHKYVTVVYDMDKNRTVWVHDGHGKDIFELFCKELTKQQRRKIKVVAGDGAKWIDSCVKKYFKRATRCIDFFHVVSWINEALNDIRRSASTAASTQVKYLTKTYEEAEKNQKALIESIKKKITTTSRDIDALSGKVGRPPKKLGELKQYLKDLEDQLYNAEHPETPTVTLKEYEDAKKQLDKMPKRGRPSKKKQQLLTIVGLYEAKQEDASISLSDAHRKTIDELENKGKILKGAMYAFGKNPENLTNAQRDTLNLIETSYPDIYKAYERKETLRAIVHMKDASLAEEKLDMWIAETKAKGNDILEKLADKIKRHRTNILNSIRLQMNSAKSEATNTTIKALIRTARGFRNLDNLFALIYLRCSDLVIPLNNRAQPSPEKQKELREKQNEYKRRREEARRNELVMG